MSAGGCPPGTNPCDIQSCKCEAAVVVNECAASVGVTTDVAEFCTYSPGGNNFIVGYQRRLAQCMAKSSATEWGNPEATNFQCNFPPSCSGYQIMDNSCGTLGVSDGYGGSCTRQSFTGDPLQCCFNNLACSIIPPSNNPPACYSDVAMQNTCSDGQGNTPNYRSLVSTDCRSLLTEYCTGTLPGDDPTSIAWLSRWTANNGGAGSCNDVVQRNLYVNSDQSGNLLPYCNPLFQPNGICNLPPKLPVSTSGFYWGQQLLTAAVKKYTSQGFVLGTLPGFQGYNPWQDFIYTNICCPTPGLCAPALANVCATKTAQQVSVDPATAQWCGCFLPAAEYEDYSVRFNISPQCSPMCNRFGTIATADVNAVPITCHTTTCLIDNVTLNLINAQIAGGIDFDQVCNNCENATCSCVVDGLTIDIANQTINGNVIPVAQGCGVVSCTQTNPGTTGPNNIPVPCGTGPQNPYDQYEAALAAEVAAAQKSSWFWTLIVVAAGLLLIFLIILLLKPKYVPYVRAEVNS